MRQQLFYLSADKGVSLQSQLREMIVRVVLGGHIPAGGAVPSCRQLAKQLGISRNTVVLAYQALVDEGYLVPRERSGYYVNGDILAGRVNAERQSQPNTNDTPNWDARLKLRPCSQRNIIKRDNWQRYQYPFVYGQFDASLFPVADWRECSRRALSVADIKGWANDGIDRDEPSLVEQLRTRVLPRRGVWAAENEILVTVGAQQALYLLAELLVKPGTTVGIEDPGYTDARNIFAIKGPQMLRLEVDDEGIVPNAELSRCDYVYTTPSHQMPTTVTMSMARRGEILRRAIEQDFVIVEDDYEAETNYLGAPTPALKSLDTAERVIYVGSLSKTIAPGLRLGYMVAPTALIEEARALRRLMLRHPPANNQRTVALFLSLGFHDSLIRRLSHAYQVRWQAMGDALERHLPNSARAPAFGGTAYWVRGPDTLDVRELEAVAAERSLLIERGDFHFLGDTPPRNFLRLGFGSIQSERIEPGVALLAELIERLS